MTAKTQKILATTDFSDNAMVGLCMAANLARTYGAALYLLHVISDEETRKMARGTIPLVPLDILAARKRERLVRQFDEALSDQEKTGVKVKPMIRFGNPWEEIVRVADEIKADVVVMATHGRTGWDHVIHGSVAEKVVRGCSRPVLTVGPQEKVAERFAFARAS